MGDGPKNQYWPDDMTDALSIMAPIPGLGSDPNAKSVSIDFNSYIDEWQEDIVASFGANFGDLKGNPPDFNYYLRPPAAGPYTEFIFTLTENANAVIQAVDGYIGVGAALISLANRRKTREDPNNEQDGIWNPKTYLYTTVRGVEALCLHHAVNTYCDSDEAIPIGVETTSRDAWNGSASHPLPEVRYSVAVTVGQVRYIYVVEASARVIEHFSIAEDGIHGLPLPDWFGEREDWDPYQPTDIAPLLPEAMPVDPGPKFRTLGSLPD